ncbi:MULTISPECIES: hypothetical protein [unclassified Pseudomonas]|uniref:hypothetical protein n=1 Tax=unclassified Pseudomonas TaxID=196821 RepID=UPI000CD290A7|nr:MULTISPECIES: hypothetical protein [unclassified Pseudomonas]POA27928.1 hypothetical protein C1887_26245 [Pseudomonas sp. GW456-R21]POA65419.1 hypothetical protein C1884_18195 [Pseudomonas sp. GW460-R15]
MDMQTTTSPSKYRKPPAGSSQFQVLDNIFEFIKKHNWKLFRIASLAFGFLIFLIYFCQNHFYPDFDLFNFVSLLAAAALLGSLMVLLIGFGFTAPGWIWSEAFFSDKPVREELKYRINGNTPKEDLDRRLINRYFFLPGFCCLATLWAAMYFFDGGTAYTIGLLAGPLLIGLVFGFPLQKNYELPPYSWLKFAITTFLAFFIGNLVALLSTLAMAKGVPEVVETMGDYQFMALCFFSSLLIFTAIGAVIRKSQRYVLIISPLLAICLMLWTNTWSALPGNIINTLGLGNYQAEQVLLGSDLCEKYKAIKSYGIDDDCALNSVHVTWSMGGLSVIKWQIADNEIKVKIPSSAILSTKLAAPKAKPNT